MRHVYTYSAASGVEKRGVVRASDDAVTVAVGCSGEVVRRSELDAPAARYFTDPLLAIQAFMTKAKAALADASRRQHHSDWRAALTDASKRVVELSARETDKQWQDRYRVTSRSGKIWTRMEVCKRAVDAAHKQLAGARPRSTIRTVVEQIVDDATFMRSRTGMVPARVVEDIASAAVSQLAAKAVTL